MGEDNMVPGLSSRFRVEVGKTRSVIRDIQTGRLEPQSFDSQEVAQRRAEELNATDGLDGWMALRAKIVLQQERLAALGPRLDALEAEEKAKSEVVAARYAEWQRAEAEKQEELRKAQELSKAREEKDARSVWNWVPVPHGILEGMPLWTLMTVILFVAFAAWTIFGNGLDPTDCIPASYAC
jgi:hypothetical protein